MTAALAAIRPAERAQTGGEGAPSAAPSVAEGQPVCRSLLTNTLVMYGRTLLTMSVSLYSSRIILAELGAVDYGIYVAVAGVTFVIAFLNSALAASTQRHLSVELAFHNAERLGAVFSASLQIHAAIALVVLCVCETLGLWFLHTHMVIPPARMQAATWAFHCAAFTVALTVLQVPYNALLAATERFSAYAAFDIAHALLRVLVALALVPAVGDRLELFSSLMMCLVVVNFLAKVGYCRWVIEASRYRPCTDFDLLRRLAGFAGWSLIEVLSVVLNIHGFALLLNLHFGPVVNASQGIAVQLANATSTLASNLQITASPGIVKSYFQQNSSQLHDLIARNSKTAFFLMLILVVPVSLEADVVLGIWLGNIPEHSVGMVRLLLVTGLVNSLSYPLVSVIQATGNIRRYQIVVGGLMLTALPLGALLLSVEAGPLSLFWLLLLLSSLALAVRTRFVVQLTGLAPGYFARAVLRPAVVVTLLSFAASALLGAAMSHLPLPDISRFMAACMVTAGAIYGLGFSDEERRWLSGMLRDRLLRSRKVSP